MSSGTLILDLALNQINKRTSSKSTTVHPKKRMDFGSANESPVAENKKL